MNNFSVLVVDDSDSLRLLAKKILQKAGLEVFTAENGEDALRCLQLNPGIRLLFLDVMMPKLPGVEFLKRIKNFKQESKLRICMLTALEDTTSVKLCLKEGADDYLIKPVDGPHLVEKVHSLMDSNADASFCAVGIKDVASLVLPDGQIDVAPMLISEGGLAFASPTQLPVGARVFISSLFLDDLLEESKPRLLRIYHEERKGEGFIYRASFTAMREDEFKKIRAFTTRGQHA